MLERHFRLPGKEYLRMLGSVFIVLLASFTIGSLLAIAAPPGSKFTPGETLDPGCAPGDLNCSVDISSSSTLWLDAGAFVYPQEGDSVAAPYINATSTTATSTFSGGLTVGTLDIGNLSGVLQATGGYVTAGAVSVTNGGTGLTSAPGYGEVLLGNASSGYTLTATSSLGIVGGNDTEIQFNNAGVLDGTSTLTWDGNELASPNVNVSSTATTSALCFLDGTCQTSANFGGSATTSTTWKEPVISKTLATPPGSPSEGDRYIVSDGAPECPSGWSDWTEITIDADQVETTMTNYTAYIEITTGGSDVFSAPQADGDDLVFFTSSAFSNLSDKLDHEIETYSQGDEKLSAWVEIPSVSASSDTTLHLCYGNPEASNQETEKESWNANWGLVYYMQDGGSDEDRSFYGRNPTSVVGNPSDDDTVLGEGLAFDGNDAFNMANITYWENEWGTEGTQTARSKVIAFETGADVTTRQTLYAEGGNVNGDLMYVKDGLLYMRQWGESNGWGNFASDVTHQTVPISANTAYVAVAAWECTGGSASSCASGSHQLHVMPVGGSLTSTTASSTVGHMNAHTGNGGIGYTNQTKDFHDTGTSGAYFTGSIFHLAVNDVYLSVQESETILNNLANPGSFYSVSDQNPGGATGAWSGQENAIAEYVSASWTFDSPEDGWAVVVTNEDLPYTYDADTPRWNLFNSTIAHNTLTGLQGGSADLSEFYHLTLNEYSQATRFATNDLGGLMPAGKLNNWDTAYNLRLANASSTNNIDLTFEDNILSADLTGIVAIANGGTGLSTAPSYGQLLLGNASGGYDLVATSSLGISGGGGGSGDSFAWTPSTTFGQSVSATSSKLWFQDAIYASSTIDIGVGGQWATTTWWGNNSSLSFESTNLDLTAIGGGAIRFPILRGTSDTGNPAIGNNGTVSGVGAYHSLTILEDTTQASQNPRISFIPDNFESTGQVGNIQYSTSTDSVTFSELDGGVTIQNVLTVSSSTGVSSFTNDLTVGGNATTSGFTSLATTTILDATDGFTFGKVDYGIYNIPSITPNNDLGLGVPHLGMWNGDMAIVENGTNLYGGPTLLFAQNDFSQATYFNYSTTTGVFTLSGADEFEVTSFLDLNSFALVQGLVDADHFVATSTNATSTFAGNLSVDGFAQFLGGIKDDSGSFGTNNYVLTTNGTDAVTWADPSSIGGGGSFAWTPTDYGVATSTILGFNNGFISAASSTVNANLVVTGNLGVGTSSPTNTLGVDGYIDTTEGYKIGGDLAFRISDANSSMLLGRSTTTLLDQLANTAVGVNALSDQTVAGSGSFNTAIGFNALGNLEGGTLNTAVGANAGALLSDSGASGNIFIGSQAGDNLTDGDNNIVICGGTASFCHFANTTGSYQINIGDSLFGAGSSNPVDDENAIGIASTTPYARLSVRGFGTGTGVNFQTTNSNNTPLFTILDNGNVGIGIDSPQVTLDVDGSADVEGDINIASGFAYQYNNVDLLSASTTLDNIFIYSNNTDMTGEDNIAVGRNTLNNLTSGRYNIAIGENAGAAIKQGFGNVYLGDAAAGTVGGISVSNDQYYNVAIGLSALGNVDSATNTVAIGASAGQGSGPNSTYRLENSVFIGATAGLNSQGGSNNNTFVGYGSGADNTTGANNIFLGYQSGDNVTTGSNNLIIGYDVDAPILDASNQLAIGNIIFGTDIDGTGTTTSSGNLGIGTSSPVVRFHIEHAIDGNIFRLQDSDGTCNYNPESGSVTVSCSSDQSLKTNIVDISATDVIEDLMKYRIREYEVLASGDILKGVVAQELQKELPERVFENEDGLLMVEMPNMWELLVAVQEIFIAFKDLGVEFVDGVARFVNIVTEKFTTQELCVGDTCITENELRELLDKANVNTSTSSNSTDDSSTDDTSNTDNSDDGADNSADTTATSTNDGSDTTTSTSTPSDTTEEDSTQTNDSTTTDEDTTSEENTPADDTTTPEEEPTPDEQSEESADVTQEEYEESPQEANEEAESSEEGNGQPDDSSTNDVSDSESGSEE